MYKVSAYMLLPLMLINLTVAENKWTVLGLHPDQYIYAFTIGLAWYAGSLSRYRGIVNIMLLLAIVLRLSAMLGADESLHRAGFVALAIVFGVAGAVIYGRKPALLHKQLVIYLGICVPVMLLQILGVSSLLMGWNVGYLHDPTLLTLDEVGTFKDVPVYPTLFKHSDDLAFTIGQIRPVGLMYGSNPLSIFVSIAVALNLAMTRTSRIGISDWIVTIVAVLTMSKLVFGVMLLLYAGYLAVGGRERRLLALKLSGLFGVSMVAYYILFPGLLVANLSGGMMMTSIMLRAVDLVKALGMEDLFGSLMELGKVYHPAHIYEIAEGYSAFATLARSEKFIPLLLILSSGSLFYLYRVRTMVAQPAPVYVITLLACVLTQFAVPFMQASPFQLILGFALFPLFTQMWLPKRDQGHDIAGKTSPI